VVPPTVAGLDLVTAKARWKPDAAAYGQHPIHIHSYWKERTMGMFIHTQADHWLHTGYKGVLALGVVLWLMLLLIGCSASRKEYVVDYTRGNDKTAQGSRERPCQTEGHCRLLAERDGVRSYWLVYQ
jgi:hypothetical protein